MEKKLGNRTYKHGSKIPCPECGQPMDKRSKRCRACFSKGTVCPNCGGPKSSVSKQCSACYGHGPKNTRYDTCPNCGARKVASNKLCFSCTHQRPEPEPATGIKKTKFVPLETPSHEWLLQFTGFFLGDGCVTGSGKSARLVLAINQRADSRILMEDIVEKLGGTLYEYEVTQTAAKSKRQCRWGISGWSRCLPVINMMLDHAILPARKFKELRLAKEWCEWRLNYSSFLGEEGRRINKDYAKRLSEAKVFKVHLG